MSHDVVLRAALSADGEVAAPAEPLVQGTCVPTPVGRAASDGSDAAQVTSQALEFATSFQPIKSLRRDEIVGYSATPIARSSFTPLGVDENMAASREDELADLDRAQFVQALQLSLTARSAATPTIIVGVEPDTLDKLGAATDAEVFARAESQLRVFLEFDERAVLTNPAGVLGAVSRARELRWGVCLRDAGRHPGTLATLALIRPNVVALDHAWLAELPEAGRARILDAVLECQECTGAAVLIRGVDTNADLERAITWQADLVQGEAAGKPDGAPNTPKPPGWAIPLRRRTSSDSLNPFEVLNAARRGRRISRRQLDALVRTLEHRCVTSAEPAVLVQTLLSSTLAKFDHHAALAAHTSLNVVLSQLPITTGPSTRLIRFHEGDPLARQQVLATLGHDFAIALAARPRGSHGGGYYTVLTRDRETVADIARGILRRVPPPRPDANGQTWALALPVPPPAEPAVVLGAAEPRAALSWWRRLLHALWA